MDGHDQDERAADDGRVVTDLLDVLGVEGRIGEIERWRNPDLDEVQALARLALQARRRGWTVQLRGPCGRMVELLDMFGLGGVVTAQEIAESSPSRPLSRGAAEGPRTGTGRHTGSG